MLMYAINDTNFICYNINLTEKKAMYIYMYMYINNVYIYVYMHNNYLH